MKHAAARCAVLLLITLLAIALRWPLASEPLWVDELHTSWVVGQGRTQLPENARAGNQAPLWFYLPWLATGRTAASDATTDPWRLRLPSLLAGLAVPWLTYLVARRLTGMAGPALFAASLAALDPRFAFYGTEARAYAAVQLLALVHFLCWLAVRGGTESTVSANAAVAAAAASQRWTAGLGWRAAWIATGGLLFFTHYTTALVLAAEAVADFGTLDVASIRWFRRSAARLIDFAALLAICAPAVPHLSAVASHRADWSRALSADDPWTMFNWYGLVVVPLFVVAAIAVQRAWTGRRPWLRPIAPSLVWRVALWILAPWLAAWAATALDVAQLLRYRYIIASATALPLVAALALAALPRRVAQGVLGAIMLTAVVARHDMLRPWWETGRWPAQRDEHWPELVERVGGLLKEKRVPVLLFPALVEDYRLKVDERPASVEKAGGPPASGPPADSAARASLVRFCRFPLDAYATRLPADATVIPLSTLGGPRLDAATLGLLAQRGGGLIVVRGDIELAAYLTRQLTAELSRNALRMTAATPESHGNLQLIAFTARK